jgi:hypothetical protein
MLLKTPSGPLEGVMMDIVTDLTESTVLAYSGILIIVDRLTMMTIYLLCQKDINSPELPRLFFEHVIMKRSFPPNIVTDCRTQFTSRFWTWVCCHLSTDHQLSTSFNPPPDGLSDRQHQTKKQYLQAFCNSALDNWVQLWQLADFPYNVAIHTFTRITPCWVKYHYHLRKP